MRSAPLVLAALAAAASVHSVHAKIIPIAGGAYHVELATAGDTAFRISLLQGKDPQGGATKNPSVAPAAPDAKYKDVSHESTASIATEFGSVSLDTNTLAFELSDADGGSITTSASLFPFLPLGQPLPQPNLRGTQHALNCSATYDGYDAAVGERVPSAPNGLNVTDLDTCCNKCEEDDDCTLYIFATDGKLDEGSNCWLMLNVPAVVPHAGRAVGGQVPPPRDSVCTHSLSGFDVDGGQRSPKHPDGLATGSLSQCCASCDADKDCSTFVYAQDAQGYGTIDCWLLSHVQRVRRVDNRIAGGALPGAPRVLELGRRADAKFFGSGGGSDAGSENVRSLAFTSASAIVANTKSVVPHYYTDDGYAALVVSSSDYGEDCLNCYPATWTSGARGEDDVVQWTVEGAQIDLYLMPAATNAVGVNALFQLSGRPPVPPRYSFGFTASRWGWTNVQYVWDNLKRFRDEKYPIDSWISDFEWYTISPDYDLPESGADWFRDFEYNDVVFPEPQAQLKAYHEELNMRFGGIRKPRLGNADLIKMSIEKGWDVNSDRSGGAEGGRRNLNYSKSEVRDWYAEQQAHFLTDGVDFYWNDEGESFYYAFHWWNEAELQGQIAFDANKRFWSINRAYTIGMARIGAATWSGDVAVSWDGLRNQPGYLLNWALSGSAYVTCDTGGFNGGDTDALLLTRWYQTSAFMGIMRVHSSLDNTPHFPFLYPDDAANAMRDVMNLRYSLLPYHYSLAHALSKPGGLPIFRPTVLEYPDYEEAATITTQWLVGDALLVSPVIDPSNSTTVLLPEGKWYPFGEKAGAIEGPQTLQLDNVPLDHVPLYARAGAVVPLAPSGVQYSDALPGGALNVHVYAGADGSFALVEDDGETLDYAKKGAKRTTTFSWDDAKRELTWSVENAGGFAGHPTCFNDVEATIFRADGSSSQSDAQKLGGGGTIHL